MAITVLSFRQWIFLAMCLFYAVFMTGCSALQTSHFEEPEFAVSPLAVASADQTFVAEPFSLIAADSIGLATFGYEIALWAEMDPSELVALQN
ncbi:MAG: hypothetical protein ACPG4Q_00380 [Phycisphaeraceae bacterium]